MIEQLRDEGDEELLIGIPNTIVFAKQTDRTASETELPSVEETAVAIQPRPETVTVPMQIEVKERYLEVRELPIHQVVTVIEVLSPKNKHKRE